MKQAPKRSKLRVLVVDQEPDNRFMLQEKLGDIEDWELAIDMAAGAVDALRLLEKTFYDLVFLNWRLPGGSSSDLLDLLGQRYTRTSAVIVATHGEEPEALEAMRRGALDYLMQQDLRAANMRNLLRRVMAKRRLQQQNSELRKVNMMKDDFIATVSHELRTPMAVILGYTKSLLAGQLGELNEGQRKAIAALDERGTELLTIINRLLEFRAAAEAKDRYLLQPLDLRGLIEAGRARFAGDAARKELKLVSEVPSGSVWVRADRERLGEALDNLVSNAVKFNRQRGTLRLALRADGGEAVFSVEDEGPGIPAEQIPKVFERFSQAGQALTREHSGLGLGLSLAKHIVELHGGRLWLEAAQNGRGIRASIALPACAPDAPEASVEEPSRVEKRRVLIVEDNPDIVELIGIFLASFSPNVDIAAARSGPEALEYLTHRKPHLMVLDIMMEGMNGLEVIDRLQRLPLRQRMPVLVLTGYPDAADKALAKGAKAALIKPFAKDAFIRTVRRLLAEEAAEGGGS